MFEMVDPLPGALKLKMPRFVIAWSIVDLVMCSLRTLELPFLIAILFLIKGHACPVPDKCLFCGVLPLVLQVELISVFAIAVTGLTGNIAMLCRRHWSLYFCFASSLLTAAGYAVTFWQVFMVFKGSSLLGFSIAVISAVLFIMIRCALLVFNLISLFKARNFYRERDGY